MSKSNKIDSVEQIDVLNVEQLEQNFSNISKEHMTYALKRFKALSIASSKTKTAREYKSFIAVYDDNEQKKDEICKNVVMRVSTFSDIILNNDEFKSFIVDSNYHYTNSDGSVSVKVLVKHSIIKKLVDDLISAYKEVHK